MIRARENRRRCGRLDLCICYIYPDTCGSSTMQRRPQRTQGSTGSSGGLLVVVYAEREEQYRLISARHATRKERKAYEG
jgi:uncharacterized DUF497 family protein